MVRIIEWIKKEFDTTPFIENDERIICVFIYCLHILCFC